ncbi:MAG: L-serine ammonia-lyase, iron-sulfur-dependent, subunit alpha [Candidatus Gastranaerophilales bacterium]|nr:L-serine ammonia-lyase, iron-sulfur-dependent, subunit alpha [Candidatus Gastranaerophilales bacterium]MCM1073214.1 L-serine ammonia-lyase, iron-sulfur-dependent, subunit alpha [Bacteroides sp.]
MAILSFSDLLEKSKKENKAIYEIAQEEEALLAETEVDVIRLKVTENLIAMREAIKNGLKSTEKSVSNWCGDDCVKLPERYKRKPALLGKVFEKITTYALATAEENLRMGRIVACPTAGSCGIVPAVLVAVSEEHNIPESKQIDGLLTAGVVGLIVSAKVRLAGAVAGCQAECGVASAMAAAALTEMLGGNSDEIVQAVSLALKNILGLTCDPVCGLVEVPCIKRNAFLAVHAVTAAELALCGVESKIPADEVVDTLSITGQLMSPLLKETSQGGLAKTKTALELEKVLGIN